MSKFGGENVVEKEEEKVVTNDAEGDGGEAPASASCLGVLSNLGTYCPNHTTRKRKVS